MVFGLPVMYPINSPHDQRIENNKTNGKALITALKYNLFLIIFIIKRLNNNKGSKVEKNM